MVFILSSERKVFNKEKKKKRKNKDEMKSKLVRSLVEGDVDDSLTSECICILWKFVGSSLLFLF